MICAADDCRAILGATNRSGYCRQHQGRVHKQPTEREGVRYVKVNRAIPGTSADTRLTTRVAPPLGAGMSDLWRDMDFALPAGHPSTFEQECKQLRAENERLRAAMWAAIDFINADLQSEARNGLRAALKGTKT